MLVDNMGFEAFLRIKAGNSDNRLIHALVERWWPSTNTFPFLCGKLGVMPLDFVTLTGISFGIGLELAYDDKYSVFEEAQTLFPRITTADIRYGNITLAYLKAWRDALNPQTNSYNQDKDLVYARAFIVYMMGNILFSNTSTSLLASYLAALTDYHILGVSRFDCGTPIMAALYQGLYEVSVLKSGKENRLLCSVRVLVLRVLSHWNVSGQSEQLQPCLFLEMIEWKDRANIDWQLWARSRQAILPKLRVATELSERRVPLVSVPYRNVTSTQVQNYGVEAYGEEVGDLGWFMEMEGSNGEHRRLPILAMQVPHLCPPRYSVDELWYQNQGIRYAAYED
ncbi:hypothetical protein GIB67_015244 [Kingdonia uniflora]|uniref:Aminotransferase-like plant mobile domain-containing protein n=1 Tax=Kingdonia uniflora TaxID=39325 RepID=A0A7J7MTA6_9MAGN|nr:hypothetical protein GIB67_015244 [Kingdonia uniflora]